MEQGAKPRSVFYPQKNARDVYSAFRAFILSARAKTKRAVRDRPTGSGADVLRRQCRLHGSLEINGAVAACGSPVLFALSFFPLHGFLWDKKTSPCLSLRAPLWRAAIRSPSCSFMHCRGYGSPRRFAPRDDTALYRHLTIPQKSVMNLLRCRR